MSFCGLRQFLKNLPVHGFLRCSNNKFNHVIRRSGAIRDVYSQSDFNLFQKGYSSAEYFITFFKNITQTSVSSSSRLFKFFDFDLTAKLFLRLSVSLGLKTPEALDEPERLAELTIA